MRRCDYSTVYVCTAFPDWCSSNYWSEWFSEFFSVDSKDPTWNAMSVQPACEFVAQQLHRLCQIDARKTSMMTSLRVPLSYTSTLQDIANKSLTFSCKLCWVVGRKARLLRLSRISFDQWRISFIGSSTSLGKVVAVCETLAPRYIQAQGSVTSDLPHTCNC